MKPEKPENPNYAATVVTLRDFVDLPGCDRIKGARLFGTQVIVGKDVQPGEKGLYFSVECALSPEFLSACSLYRPSKTVSTEARLTNADPSRSGFFEPHGRVKCVKFRGHKSEGFWMPIGSLTAVLGESVYHDTFAEGDTFDKLGDFPICHKYVSKRRPGRGFTGQLRTRKVEDRIVPGQFAFHYDTEKLARHLDWLEPESVVSVSDKWHGTSVVIGNLLTSRQLPWYERLLRRLGVQIRESQYGLVWSSRRTIKGVAGEAKTGTQSYYDSDVWGSWAKALKSSLPQGYTVYAEIVGHTPSGGVIQAGYSYGCLIGSRLLVYRVTFTSQDGTVFELPWLQMRGWCSERGLETVPSLYWGRADGLEPKLESDTLYQWRDELLRHIQETWVHDQDCPHNAPGTPAEGVVVRIDYADGTCRALKCKNYRFLEQETRNLDKDVPDLEESQEVPEADDGPAEFNRQGDTR